jgi:hypothetical protein
MESESKSIYVFCMKAGESPLSKEKDVFLESEWKVEFYEGGGTGYNL